MLVCKKLVIQLTQDLQRGDLENFQTIFQSAGYQCELVDLIKGINDNILIPTNLDAHVLIIRNGIEYITKMGDHTQLFNELINLNYDKKAKMKGKVVNKHARYNLCFDKISQEPNYDQGKGRIISYDEIPITNKIKNFLESLINKNIPDAPELLVAEANYYYDIAKCGINFHGDSERKKVIAFRIGAPLGLFYQWYHCCSSVSPIMEFNLNEGDIYFMSEKATGNDWKKQKILTLRHAAGSKSFLKI